jgi:hypothetical protein
MIKLLSLLSERKLITVPKNWEKRIIDINDIPTVAFIHEDPTAIAITIEPVVDNKEKYHVGIYSSESLSPIFTQKYSNKIFDTYKEAEGFAYEAMYDINENMPLN